MGNKADKAAKGASQKSGAKAKERPALLPKKPSVPPPKPTPRPPKDLPPPPEDVSTRDLRLLDTGELNKRPSVSSLWYTSMAVVALLDFLAKVVADFVREPEEEVPILGPAPQNPFVPHRATRHRVTKEMLEDADPMIVNFIQFLDVYSIPISMLFSLLWFTNAFIRATEKRDAALYRIDRKNVLLGEKSDEDLEEMKGAWGSFYRTLIIQCLLLPISFYIIIHHLVQAEYSAKDILLDEDEEVRFGFKNKEGEADEDLPTFKLSQSVVFVITKFCGTAFARHTGWHIRKNIKRKIRRLTRRVAFKEIRNPRKLWRHVRQALHALRWLKYLAPLIGASNKLKGNTMDLIKKYKQKRRADRLERARKLIWNSQLAHLSPERKREQAATMIQAVWRKRRVRKATKALLLIQGDDESIAAQRLQFFFRRKVQLARESLSRKRTEFNDLQRRHDMSRKSKGNLSVDERRRLYELQDDMKYEASQLLNQKMLLRPNTRFAVTWKIIFVVCVLFEISQLALKPTLSKYVDEETGEKMDIGMILEMHLVPTLTFDLEECGAKVPKKRKRRFVRAIPGKRLLSKMRRKAEEDATVLTEEEEPTCDESKPWFCHKPFSTAHNNYARVIRFIVQEFLVVVGIVCFMDVFVTFFVGEIDQETGNLIPKAFFTRWILPGIILQLLVNPQMTTVSSFVWQVLEYAHHAGPIRVYRWIAAFFYPFFGALGRIIMDTIWRPIVKKNNSHTLESDPFARNKTLDTSAKYNEMKNTNDVVTMTAYKSLSVHKLV